MRPRVEGAVRIARRAPLYPAALERLGDDAPASITLFGNTSLLEDACIGLFCSIHLPGSTVLEALDLARALATTRRTLVGGFQSPMEREMLRYLLGGTASVVLCPARGLEGMTLPARWRRPLRESRLLLLSAVADPVRRPTARVAELRNRVAAALSSRLIILHATSGGRLSRLAREASGWGVPLHCLDHASNEDLRVLGACPLRGPLGHDG